MSKDFTGKLWSEMLFELGGLYETHMTEGHMIYGNLKDSLVRQVKGLLCEVDNNNVLVGLEVGCTREVCGQEEWCIALSDIGVVDGAMG